MSELEKFWMQVYVAAIGCDRGQKRNVEINRDATSIADRAVQDFLVAKPSIGKL